MTKIKICGLRRPCDITYVNEASPDYCGFIVNFPKSFRSVTPKEVRSLTKELSKSILPVGVFVNPNLEDILELTGDGTLKAVQLHGQEPDFFIREVKAGTGVPVIKACSIASLEDVQKAFESPADFVLLDNGTGGTGQTFDWSLLPDFDRPFFLAGGLNEQNLAEAISRFHPYAVDLSSGVETDTNKDREKILAAVAAVRRTKL